VRGLELYPVTTEEVTKGCYACEFLKDDPGCSINKTRKRQGDQLRDVHCDSLTAWFLLIYPGVKEGEMANLYSIQTPFLQLKKNLQKTNELNVHRSLQTPRQHANVSYISPQAKGRMQLPMRYCFEAHHIYSFYSHGDLHLVLYETSIVPRT